MGKFLNRRIVNEEEVFYASWTGCGQKSEKFVSKHNASWESIQYQHTVRNVISLLLILAHSC